MVVQPIDVKKDLFRHYENSENLLGLEVPYPNVIGALMYFTNCIVQILFFFFVNLLVKYSFALTRRHLNDIKHVLRNPRGITDMSVFYSNKSKPLYIIYLCVFNDFKM